MTMEVIDVKGVEVKLDGFLVEKLKLIKKYQQKDFDVVGLVDGQEGSGKSTLALAMAYYLSDGALTPYHIIEGSEDAVKKLGSLADKSVVVIDEGSLLFTSTDVMKKEQKHLVKILQVMRQKNMIVLIVAPSFFDLSKYIAVKRSKFLIHVYSKGFARGRMAYYDEKRKKILYELGKKRYGSYSKPHPLFRGRFNDFRTPFHEEYLKQKRSSLQQALDFKPQVNAQKEAQMKVVRNNLKREEPLTQPVISTLLGISTRQIRTYTKEIKAEEGIGQGIL